MANFKTGAKKVGRYTWTLFKSSILPSLMYICASSILMMLLFKGEKVVWDGGKIAWTVICILGGAGYNLLTMWGYGGNAYEMLVSGNVKRSTMDAYGNVYKMSSHKEAQEYRVWKGFAIGAFVALFPILFGVLFSAKQDVIVSGEYSMGFGILIVVGFFLAGWSTLPLYCMSKAGIAVNYYVSLLFVLIPILVSGAGYIIGAYYRRNKAIKKQEAEARIAEAQAKKEKKINYGGLPGTKPKKRK